MQSLSKLKNFSLKLEIVKKLLKRSKNLENELLNDFSNHLEKQVMVLI
jgi:hypothetical protein